MNNLNCAVIGCGNISRFHFSGLEKAGATIRWVCDPNEEAAAKWKDKFKARYSADYRYAIADPQIRLLCVTTPSRFHKEICLAAIAAGKAVVCEKTLAENAEDALEITNAAEKAGTVFFTSYMKRFIPAVAKARELLPGLGRLLSGHLRTNQCWGDLWSKTPEKGMFHTPAGGVSAVKQNYGGGILVCGGSHILDLLLLFFGRPERLHATVHVPDDGRDYDLRASSLLETAQCPVHFEAMTHPLRHIGFLGDGWDERIEISGVNGRLEIRSGVWDAPESKPSQLVHYDNTSGCATEYRFEGVSPFDEAMAFFCRQAAKGEQGEQSRQTGYEVDELIAHILLSSARREAVAVQWRR